MLSRVVVHTHVAQLLANERLVCDGLWLWLWWQGGRKGERGGDEA